jgi:ABC-type transport system involved in multi-copper enzyme maturation permease subunit
MRVAAAVRNELLKLRKRPATWVTLGFLALVTGLQHGGEWWQARQNADEAYALPGAWPEILGETTQVSLIFGSVLLVLLVASEFSWRTARQNVIDGLSRETWFWGKSLVVPVVGALALALQILVGGGFALAGTDLSALGAPLVGLPQLSALAGGFLAFLGYGSLALAAALAIRSTGAAMGVWFFWVALGERLVQGALGLLGGTAEAAAAFLPVAVFNRLTSYLAHDPAAWAEAAHRAAVQGEPAPALPDLQLAVWAAVAWIAVLVGVSWAVFRRRDL